MPADYSDFNDLVGCVPQIRIRLQPKIRSINSNINAKMNESIQGMPIIQAFRREKETMKEFEELNEAHFRYKNKMLSLNSLMSHSLVNVLRNLAFVGLIWYFGGASLSAAGIVSIGVLYAFVDYLNRLFQPVTGIVNQFSKLELARVSAARVFELYRRRKQKKKALPQTERRKGQWNSAMFLLGIERETRC